MRRTPFANICLLVAFLFNSVITVPIVQAQELVLPKPGVMVHLSPSLHPAMLKGMKVNPNNPFRFEFILDQGDTVETTLPAGRQAADALKDESSRLIKYFLASLTIPEKDLWVNLSPYEKDRIVPDSFGLTEMGRDLLAQDYILKQVTASLIYPEDEVGKKFWKRVYEEAAKKYGKTSIPVNTFNKVWIVPEKAVVYENAKAGTAYVVESKLKVMLEADYLSLEKNTVGAPLAGAQTVGAGASPARTDVNQIGSQIVREIVIPELTKEINEGANFAQLRQVYSSLILATWYKKKIKDSILSKVYADRNKIAGIQINDVRAPLAGALDGVRAGVNPAHTDVEQIYQQYLTAFKKGVYNYIKDEPDPISGQIQPRKYFSGGFHLDMAMMAITSTAPDKFPDQAMKVDVRIDQAMTKDAAMLSRIRKLLTRQPQVTQGPVDAVKEQQAAASALTVEDVRQSKLVKVLKDGKVYRLKGPKGEYIVKISALHLIEQEAFIYRLAALMGVNTPREEVLDKEVVAALGQVTGINIHPSTPYAIYLQPVDQMNEDDLRDKEGSGLERMIILNQVLRYLDLQTQTSHNVIRRLLGDKERFIEYDFDTVEFDKIRADNYEKEYYYVNGWIRDVLSIDSVKLLEALDDIKANKEKIMRFIYQDDHPIEGSALLWLAKRIDNARYILLMGLQQIKTKHDFSGKDGSAKLAKVDELIRVLEITASIENPPVTTVNESLDSAMTADLEAPGLAYSFNRYDAAMSSQRSVESLVMTDNTNVSVGGIAHGFDLLERQLFSTEPGDVIIHEDFFTLMQSVLVDLHRLTEIRSTSANSSSIRDEIDLAFNKGRRIFLRLLSLGFDGFNIGLIKIKTSKSTGLEALINGLNDYVSLEKMEEFMRLLKDAANGQEFVPAVRLIKEDQIFVLKRRLAQKIGKVLREWRGEKSIPVMLKELLVYGVKFEPSTYSRIEFGNYRPLSEDEVKAFTQLYAKDISAMDAADLDIKEIRSRISSDEQEIERIYLENNRRFGQILRIKGRGIGVKLSARTGISKASISIWGKEGFTGRIDLQYMPLLAKELEVNIERLLGDKNQYQFYSFVKAAPIDRMIQTDRGKQNALVKDRAMTARTINLDEFSVVRKLPGYEVWELSDGHGGRWFYKSEDPAHLENELIGYSLAKKLKVHTPHIERVFYKDRERIQRSHLLAREGLRKWSNLKGIISQDINEMTENDIHLEIGSGLEEMIAFMVFARYGDFDPDVNYNFAERSLGGAKRFIFHDLPLNNLGRLGITGNANRDVPIDDLEKRLGPLYLKIFQTYIDQIDPHKLAQAIHSAQEITADEMNQILKYSDFPDASGFPDALINEDVFKQRQDELVGDITDILNSDQSALRPRLMAFEKSLRQSLDDLAKQDRLEKDLAMTSSIASLKTKEVPFKTFKLRMDAKALMARLDNEPAASLFDEFKKFAVLNKVNLDMTKDWYRDFQIKFAITIILENLIQHEYFDDLGQEQDIYYRFLTSERGVRLEFWGPAKHPLPTYFIDESTEGAEYKWFDSTHRPWDSKIAPADAVLEGRTRHEGISHLFDSLGKADAIIDSADPDADKQTKIGWREDKGIRGHFIALDFPNIITSASSSEKTSVDPAMVSDLMKPFLDHRRGAFTFFKLFRIMREHEPEDDLTDKEKAALAILRRFKMFSIHGDAVYDQKSKTAILFTGRPTMGKSSLSSRLIKDPRFDIRADDSVIGYFDEQGALWIIPDSQVAGGNAVARGADGENRPYATINDKSLKFMRVGTLIHLSKAKGIKDFRINPRAKITAAFNDDTEYLLDQDKFERLKASKVNAIHIDVPDQPYRDYDQLAESIIKELSDQAMTVTAFEAAQAHKRNLEESGQLKEEASKYLEAAALRIRVIEEKFFHQQPGKIVISDDLVLILKNLLADLVDLDALNTRIGEHISSSVSSFIRDYLAKTGKSQKMMGAPIGIDQGFISKLLSQSDGVPAEETRQRFLGLPGISYDQLTPLREEELRSEDLYDRARQLLIRLLLLGLESTEKAILRINEATSKKANGNLTAYDALSLKGLKEKVDRFEAMAQGQVFKPVIRMIQEEQFPEIRRQLAVEIGRMFKQLRGQREITDVFKDERLIVLLREKGINLSNKIKGTYYRLERGSFSQLPENMIFAFANFYGVPVSSLDDFKLYGQRFPELAQALNRYRTAQKDIDRVYAYVKGRYTAVLADKEIVDLEALGRTAGISVETLKFWKRGNDKYRRNLQNAVLLAQVLGLKTEDLLGDMDRYQQIYFIKTGDSAQLSDKVAKPADTGGIDLTADQFLQTRNAGEGIKFRLDPAMLQQLQNAPGFTPVIISIQPMVNVREFLGIGLN